MIEKAIEKIKSEMEANKSFYTQRIGEYLLKQIEINKNAATAIVKEDKNIQGAVTQIAIEARKHMITGPAGIGNVGCIPDAEGFEIVRKYFGFEAVQDRMIDVDVNEIKNDVDIEDKKVNSNVEFDVKLEDLLS